MRPTQIDQSLVYVLGRTSQRRIEYSQGQLVLSARDDQHFDHAMRQRTAMKVFRVHDGERVIEFEGVVLASVSSATKSKARWIELTLYRTRAGTYVLHGVGRSTVRGEVDRQWVQLADNPEGIIDRLYLANNLGARYIPRTSRALLLQAGDNDDEIRRAFAVERVA